MECNASSTSTRYVFILMALCCELPSVRFESDRQIIECFSLQLQLNNQQMAKACHQLMLSQSEADQYV
ncbi:Fusion glycoprotein [Trichinella spiralis]|uniref:Fusion glycoprotein n=1 Tax=Trichinella spiralis TaxID=6334 RepID=A0ABR3L0X0_TRISP